METKTGNIFFERISVFGNESFFSEYASGFRFGFNGKEKTDELYGTGNAYDFGARMFDPRLGRWFSTDVLFAKYPYQSPYSFVGNSPILKQEFNGMDYGVYINHDTKTIIIKATYYTLKGDKDSYSSALKATQFWNQQSGKFQYEVGGGKDAVHYNVTFALTVKQSANPSQDAQKDDIANFLKTGKMVHESNVYQVKSDNSKDFVDNKKPDEITEGYTNEAGNIISVKVSQKSNGIATI